MKEKKKTGSIMQTPTVSTAGVTSGTASYAVVLDAEPAQNAPTNGAPHATGQGPTCSTQTSAALSAPRLSTRGVIVTGDSKISGKAGTKTTGPHTSMITTVAVAVSGTGSSTRLGSGSDTLQAQQAEIGTEGGQLASPVEITSNTTLKNLTGVSVNGETSQATAPVSTTGTTSVKSQDKIQSAMNPPQQGNDTTTETITTATCSVLTGAPRSTVKMPVGSGPLVTALTPKHTGVASSVSPTQRRGAHQASSVSPMCSNLSCPSKKPVLATGPVPLMVILNVMTLTNTDMSEEKTGANCCTLLPITLSGVITNTDGMLTTQGAVAAPAVQVPGTMSILVDHSIATVMVISVLTGIVGALLAGSTMSVTAPDLAGSLAVGTGSTTGTDCTSDTV